MLGIFNDDWSVGSRYHMAKLIIIVVILILVLWSVFATTITAAMKSDSFSSESNIRNNVLTRNDLRFASQPTTTGFVNSTPEGFLGGNGSGAPVFWNIGNIDETRKALAAQQSAYENDKSENMSTMLKDSMSEMLKESATDWKESYDGLDDASRWNDLREGKFM